MPTYILHGGRTSLEHPSNDAFFQQMVSRVPQGGTWLGCYFSRLAETEAVKFPEDAAKVRAAAPHDIHIELATSEGFLDQLQRADVLYFAGGSTAGLLNQLSVWPDIRERLLKIPVIAGSSAGMIILGLGGVGKAGLHKGLGFVPFNMRVHFGHPDYATADATPLPQPVLALEETQFAIFEM